jgi:Ino eighty subunit 2
MSSRRSQRSAAVKAAEAITDAASDRMPSSRPRRTASENVSMATVSRGPPTTSSRSPQSMRLTVKTSSSKLREATRSSSAGHSAAVSSRDAFVGGEIIEGKRARNVRKSYVLESDSDEEEEEEEDEEMEDVVDDDAEGESEEDEDMDAEDDGLGDEDADGDVDMDVPPPPPVIKISKAQSGRQAIVVKPPTRGDRMTVEQKEMQEASDDEELSELDSDVGEEVEEVEEEEGMQTGNEEDAEGEEEEIEVEEEVDEEDDDSLDSLDDTPGGGSRASTPDLNKLTKRQRARLEEGGSGHLLALPDGTYHSLPG